MTRKLLRRLLIAGSAGLVLLTAASPALADPATLTAFFFFNTSLSVAASATAAAITSFVIDVGLSLALNKGLQVLSAREAKQNRQASILQLTLGESPREAIFGTAVTGGTLDNTGNSGGTNKTDREERLVIIADHLCDALEGYWVNDTYYAFTGDGAQSAFNNGGKSRLNLFWRNGSATQYPPVGSAYSPVLETGEVPMGIPIGTPLLSGVAHVWISMLIDDKVWNTGRPTFRFKVRGKKLYDPRKDSSVGGSGAHRWATPSTWEWSANAYLARYNYARGIYANDRVDLPDQLLIGRGLTAAEAPPAQAFARANICDESVTLKAGGAEPRYQFNGVVSAATDFDQAEQDFAAAMAGDIIQHQGAIDIDPGVAKSSVVSFTDLNLVTGAKVTFNDFLPAPQRINSVVPRYVAPDQGWTDHAAPTRRSTTDITADGGPLEDTLSLIGVISGTHAQRCAEIKRRKGRLERSATVTLPPRFSAIEEGDWVTWTSDRYHGGAAVIYQVQAWAENAAGQITLQLREIASSVFAWTASSDELTPNSAPVPEPAPLAALTLPGMAVAAVSLAAGGGVTTPALKFTWTTPVDDAVLAIRFEVRVLGGSDVAYTTLDRLDAVQAGVAVVSNGVAGGVALQARATPISNPGRLVTSTTWTTVTAADLVAAGVPWTGVSDPTGTRPEDNATVGATLGVDVYYSPTGPVLAHAEVVTSEGTSQNTSNVGSRAAGTVNSDLNSALSGVATNTSDISGLFTSLGAVTVLASAVKDILPARFDQDGAFFTAQYNVYPGADLAATFATVSGEGRVVQHSGAGWTEVTSKGMAPLTTGASYGYLARLAQPGGSVVNINSTGDAYVTVWNTARAYLGLFSVTVTPASTTIDSTFRNYVGTVTTAAILAAYPTAAFVRPGYSLGYPGGSGYVTQISTLRLTDSSVTALGATVTSQAGAIATLNADGSITSAAYLKYSAAVGPVEAKIELAAKAGDAAVRLVAPKLQLAATTGGVVVSALDIQGDLARYTGNLNVGGKITIGSGAGVYVAMESKTYLLGDGEAWSAPTVTGANPIIVPDFTGGTGLIALGSGEKYSFVASGLTPSGFTAVIKKIVPGSLTARTSTGGASSGSGPQYQMDKADTADAADGNYTSNFTVTLTYEEIVSVSGGDDWYYLYGFTATTWVKATSGGAWVQVGSQYFSGTTTASHAANGASFTVSGQTFSVTGAYTGAIGTHAAKEFGVSADTATVTAFGSVTYLSESGASTAAALSSGGKIPVTITLRNAP